MLNPAEYPKKEKRLIEEYQKFCEGWAHFCGCIPFATSALDAKAIEWANNVTHVVWELTLECMKNKET